MKFKVAVIAILVAILGVTTAGTVLVVQEAREQTRIALKTATELNTAQAEMNTHMEILATEAKAQTELAQKTAELTYMQTAVYVSEITRQYGGTSDTLTIRKFNEMGNYIYETSQIGKSINEKLWESLKEIH